MAKNKKEEAAMHALPVGERQKELMMIVLLRDEAALLAVRQHLKTHHFKNDDRRYAVVWNTLLSLYDELGVMPTEDQMKAEIEQQLPVLSTQLFDEDFEVIDTLLTKAHALDASAINPTYGIKRARQFITDSLAHELSVSTSEWMVSRPADYGKLLGKLHEEAQMVDSMEIVEDADTGLFGENWKPKTVRKISTGVPFWDAFMNGGRAAAECYGLLGPFGSCKTTLMTQTAVAACRDANRAWRENGKKGSPKITYYFSYEENETDISPRFMGIMGQIHRSSLECEGDDEFEWSRLADSEYRDYERNVFAAAMESGVSVPFELQRCKTAVRALRRTMSFHDMTGGDDKYPGRGGGLDEEMAAIIRNHQRQLGNPGVQSIFVDYAGAAIERHVSSHDKDEKAVRFLLKHFPLRCKRTMASPFNTTVWIAHQLNGTANSKGSAQKQHHTDAAESKSFAENLAFCFTVGTKDDTTNMCVLAKTKGRRAAASPTRVIRVDGEMFQVSDQDHLYTIDPATNRIARRADLNRVHDPARPRQNLPGATVHQMPQFNLAEIGNIPNADDDGPRRRLDRRR